MKELQKLMDKYDSNIKIKIILSEFSTPKIIGECRNVFYSFSFSQEYISDLHFYGQTENQIYSDMIDKLYQAISFDKYYLRTKKLEKLID